MVNIYQSTLVIDIETTGLDFNKNGIKRVGMYSYQTKQFILTSDLDEVQRILNRHETIVGYNINEFDEPFLNAKGVMIKGKVLDLYHILKKRIPIIKHKFDSLKLKNACDKLGLGMKGDIDLNVLIAENNTDEEKVLIDKYLKQDVQITKNLYEWFENEFSVFKQFIPMSDAMNYGHLTLSVGSFSYKAVCMMAGLEEKYSNSTIEEEYTGGFVSIPTCKQAKGNIYCLDLTSAYPHAFMMQNLYTNSDIGYNGNDLWSLKGTYNNKEFGIIERVIQKLFNLRREYKKLKDPREYAIKIIINTLYGLTGNPKFSQLYNITTASDCTHTVQEWIKYARKTFKENGYDVLYTDTDSVYLIDTFDDEQRLLAIKDKLIQDIKDRVPFPLDTFDMGIDERISSIYFFENKDKKSNTAKKKSYVYITENKDLVIKGLAVIKKNSSKLSKLIVKKLTQEMIDKNDIFFSKKLINDMIIEELNKNINIVRTKFNIGSKSSYTSTTSIQVAILEEYGEGTHRLIKNKKIGVGKGVKYCSLEEAKTLTIADLDLSTIWNELSPFIKTAPVRSVFSF